MVDEGYRIYLHRTSILRRMKSYSEAIYFNILRVSDFWYEYSKRKLATKKLLQILKKFFYFFSYLCFSAASWSCSSVCAPIIWSTAFPSFIQISVGILMTRYSCASSGCASTSIFQTFIPESSSSFKTGIIP